MYACKDEHINIHMLTHRPTGAVAVGQLVECLSAMGKALGSMPPPGQAGCGDPLHSPSISTGRVEGTGEGREGG